MSQLCQLSYGFSITPVCLYSKCTYVTAFVSRPYVLDILGYTLLLGSYLQMDISRKT